MDVANRVRELRGDGPALLGPREGGQHERARFEAWAKSRNHTWTRWGDAPGDVKPLFVSEVAGHYISRETQAAWEAWQHLSAQPSPGGQADELDLDRVLSLADVHAEESREDGVRLLDRGGLLAFARDVAAALAACSPVRIYGCCAQPEGELHTAECPNMRHLAARQPVDEVSVKKEDANNYCLILRALGMEEEGDPVAEVKALIEARDRQPVGEPVAWLVHWSDMPMESPEVTRSASRISEVSALTNPPRIVPLYAAPPAQAVDLGAVREALQAAEGLATVCASVDGYSREEVAASGRAMRQQFAEALAKVGSKAVGK